MGGIPRSCHIVDSQVLINNRARSHLGVLGGYCLSKEYYILFLCVVDNTYNAWEVNIWMVLCSSILLL